MLKIGLDVMGGDFAPVNEVKGAIQALTQSNGDFQIVLFGDEKAITGVCESVGFDSGNFIIVDCPEHISAQDTPTLAIMNKRKSSLVMGLNMLSAKEIDAFASTGNTGAMMVGCCTMLKMITNVIRPCISVELPNISGKKSILLDVGFNADCRPDQLLQFGWLGHVYAKSVFGIDNPRVALLNIGAEKGKGTLVAKEACELMSHVIEYNFVGNIEADKIFTEDIADVIVTDGFSGNIVLKQAESFYDVALKRGVNDEFINRFNYELYGGTPVLGTSSVVIIGHGRSTPNAIAHMILNAENVLKCKLIENFSIFAN